MSRPIPVNRNASGRTMPTLARSLAAAGRSLSGSNEPENWTIFEQLLQADLSHRPSRDSFHSPPRSLRTQPSALSIISAANSTLTAEPSEIQDAPERHKPVDPTPPAPPPRKTVLGFPILTTLQRNVLKCAIAYLIGSLFTFIPALSRLIAPTGGPSLQGHLVATV